MPFVRAIATSLRHPRVDSAIIATDANPEEIRLTTDTKMLDKEDIKALRQATTVGFVRRADGDFLVASKEITKDGPFTSGEPTELHRDIAVRGRIVNYRKYPQGLDLNASEYLSPGADELRTFRAFLRTGDEIELEWTAGNDSEPIREAGFTCDELRVFVRRGEGSARKSFCFLLKYRVVNRGGLPMVYPRTS
jgi:hypothetical protein